MRCVGCAQAHPHVMSQQKMALNFNLSSRYVVLGLKHGVLYHAGC